MNREEVRKQIKLALCAECRPNDICTCGNVERQVDRIMEIEGLAITYRCTIGMGIFCDRCTKVEYCRNTFVTIPLKESK